MPNNRDWKEYEDAIYRHYKKQQNSTVRRDVRLPNQGGRRRQIDVLVETTAGMDFPVRIAIEAKHYNKKLDSDTYDAIRTKFVSVGVDLGVIYCPHGLESGPMGDLERSTHPRILLRQKTLDDLLSENWGDDILDALDKMASAKEDLAPGDLVQEEVVATIERIPLYARFFFHKLDNPVWLPILSERGVLMRCLRGENQVPPLLASEYVLKLVEKEPGLFLQFCESVTDSIQWLETDLIQGASRLPQDRLPKFLEIACQWPFFSLIETRPIADLIQCQVRAGHGGQALNLLSRVTRLREEPSDFEGFGSMVRLGSQIEEHWFKELTIELLPKLVADAPEVVAEYTRKRLIETMVAERPDGHTTLTTMEVANLAERGGLGPFTIVSILVYTYRDVLVALGERDAELLSEFVKGDLTSRENGALVRAALYSAAECADTRVEVLRHALAQDNLWRDFNIIPELEHLVKRAWPHLDIEVREAVADRVMRLQTFIYRSANIDQEDAELYRKNHVIDWILLLQELGLPPSREGAAVAMQAEYSSATGKTARFEHMGVQTFVVDPTPDDARSFAEKSAQDVLEYCSKFVPTHGFIEEKTPEGVARQLRLEVARRPVEFLKNEDLLVRLPYPAYHGATADGLVEALRNDVDLDRNVAAGLLGRVVTEARYTVAVGGTGDSFDYGDSSWVRRSVAEFLDQAAQGDADALGTQESLFTLWQMLWPDADRSTAETGDVDALTEVINSESGRLSMALCRLALRVAGPPPDDASREDLENREDWKAKLFDVVDEELLASPAPVVRAPLGLFFTGFFSVDRAWAEARADRIFDRRQPIVWESAWACHFWIRGRRSDVFLQLRDQYEYALDLTVEVDTHRTKWITAMGEDFGLFWMEGVLRADDPLLQRFWKTAFQHARRSAASWIGASLETSNWYERWPRAKAWWQMAFDHMGEASSEMAPFPGWLRKAPDELTLGEVEQLVITGVRGEEHYLDERVLDFLEARASAEPLACARVVKAIAGNSRLQAASYRVDRLMGLMNTLYEIGSDGAKAVLVDAKRTLLAAGLFQYRDALGGASQEG